MKRNFLLRALFHWGSSFLLMLASCQSADQPALAVRPQSVALEGTWHQDSASVNYYNPHHGFIRQAKYPLAVPGILTILPTSWRYQGNGTGSFHLTHYGNKLIVQQERIGHENGRTDTLDILLLTAHHLVLRDSSNGYPDGSINVCRDYYCR